MTTLDSATLRKQAAPAPADAAHYLPLVKQIAHGLSRRLPSHIDFDDLMGAGVLGLLEAIKRFERGRNVTFAVYAKFRIRGAMLDELRRRDLMARDARIEAKTLERSLRDLTQSLGRPPEEDELAQHLELDVETLRERLTRLAPVQITDFDDRLYCADNAAESALDDVENRELRQHLAAAIGQLSERQQQVLHLYYQEELTLREIGVVLDVTESRVSQIMTAATLQLRASLQETRDAGGHHV